jgi:beta-lactam-binding protein with PASTA domain
MRTLVLAAAATAAVVTLVAGCRPSPETTLPTPVTQPPVTASAQTPTDTMPTVPDVVGKRLSDAIQVLSAAGYSKVEQVDASEKGRPVLQPVNWIVRSQEPAGGSPAAQDAAITLRVTKPTDDAGSTGTVPGVVPNVVCKDLQSAQDILQAAGFFNLRSEDASGRGRQQLIDRNWVVVDQSVASGNTPDRGTRITLSVVKFGEPTGDSGCRS